ncbi:TetR/AcrR family transcriptional regulator [Actinomadura montaniterrae]|uniref:TetR/AcrR family transcriptional regulator n=1 Tax=Actinomadura montaniterrae TaxID=1803903 RepID=A0A6L3VRM8_9ACTN|nr:TetR/AcrR family transcriptional regulator [Actinomadura montaniterrae]KAB2379474.1 TetR/AcrR family transcriptional regulator [Actinomadura montaniterrae]
MSPAKARGPYAKTAARRADIVRAARDGFAERGFAQSSLRDIAQRAGITHAGLLHHFRTKDELLAAVLAQRDAEEWERGSERVSEAKAAAPFFDGLLRDHQREPELMRLWAELAVAASRSDHPAHEYFVDRYERARARTARMMGERVPAGPPEGAPDPETAAMIFHAVLYGLQVQWLLNPRLDIGKALEHALRLLLDGPAAPSDPSSPSSATEA